MFRDCLTTLYCADLDAALRFYRDRLGFTETFRYPRDGAPLHVELRLGGAVIALSTLDAIAAYGLPATRGEPFELALGADDTDAAVATLRADGVRVLTEPMIAPNGQRVAYVADPDGNRVRIWS
jgi:catechol 2,3-dioxygenase-like lactoylglutathione lyase family enzyme